MKVNLVTVVAAIAAFFFVASAGAQVADKSADYSPEALRAYADTAIASVDMRIALLKEFMRAAKADPKGAPFVAAVEALQAQALQASVVERAALVAIRDIPEDKLSGLRDRLDVVEAALEGVISATDELAAAINKFRIKVNIGVSVGAATEAERQKFISLLEAIRTEQSSLAAEREGMRGYFGSFPCGPSRKKPILPPLRPVWGRPQPQFVTCTPSLRDGYDCVGRADGTKFYVPRGGKKSYTNIRDNQGGTFYYDSERDVIAPLAPLPAAGK